MVCGFVEQRGVGQFQPGQVDHHLLVIQQGFEATLRNFGLIRSVSGIPAGVFQHIALDDGGHQRVMVAHADQGFFDDILPGHALEPCQGFVLRQGIRQPQRRGQAYRRRNGLHDQLFKTGRPDHRQHARNFIRVRADMTGDESITLFKFKQVGGVRHGCGDGCGNLSGSD